MPGHLLRASVSVDAFGCGGKEWEYSKHLEACAASASRHRLNATLSAEQIDVVGKNEGANK